jgi:hypothetical protein
VVREGMGAGGRNDPNLVSHMNNKTIKNYYKQKVLNLMVPLPVMYH